eukprot:TRINITY_DN778162_c0_g1_i1.p1 TRINITY_DN778162_c0_g1~~TRINITY_DN778162_c0_g1_i1.p1  ORF type:complete len:293 (-),score=68.71 TRINITY_DN778162_c0_g1_i1:289-1167(-)
MNKLLLIVVLCFCSTVFAFDWRNVTTADAMRHVPVSRFRTMTKTDVENVCKNSQACAGLIAPQIANIPFESFNGFNSKCTSRFQTSACLALSSNALENFQCNGIDGLSSDCFRHIRSDFCGGFNDLGCLQDYAFHYMTGDCITNSEPEAWKEVVYAQVSKLPAESCSSFRKSIFQHLTFYNVFDGFQKDCMANFKPETCSGILRLNMLGDNVKNITPDCMSNIDSDACKSVFPNFIPNLTCENIKAMDYECINNWDLTAFKNLSDDQCDCIPHSYSYSEAVQEAINKRCKKQ